MTCQKLLDLIGLQFDELAPGAPDGKQDDAPRVPHGDGGCRVPVVGEECFDRNDIRPKPRQEFADVRIQFRKAIHDGRDVPRSTPAIARGPAQPEHAGFYERGVKPITLHAAIARDSQPGINAEESHGRECTSTFRVVLQPMNHGAGQHVGLDVAT